MNITFETSLGNGTARIQKDGCVQMTGDTVAMIQTMYPRWKMAKVDGKWLKIYLHGGQQAEYKVVYVD